MEHKRYIILTRVDIECDTPLKVGNGEKDLYTNSCVCLDENDLPYIPGTSVTGILRHELPIGDGDRLFGTTDIGSRLSISDARLLYDNDNVSEGFLNEWPESLNMFCFLPQRQHVRIGHLGAKEANGMLFNEQIVYAGARFRFEMSLISDSEDQEPEMAKLMSILKGGIIRLGGGTRRGFGKISVVSIKQSTLDLTRPEHLNLYLEKSSSLKEEWKGWKDVNYEENGKNQKWARYILKLKPENSLLFASGFGDKEADKTPKKEQRIEWRYGKPVLTEAYKLVPASSVKGTISHRTAFHFNRLCKKWADEITDWKACVGASNKAVLTLFGGEDRNGNLRRGNVIVSDIYFEAKEQKFNHVSIDNYTGGAYPGHLFNEKVVWDKNLELTLDIYVEKVILESNQRVKEAFESALSDLCNGFLPLGGGINRGHGVFIGKMEVQ